MPNLRSLAAYCATALAYEQASIAPRSGAWRQQGRSATYVSVFQPGRMLKIGDTGEVLWTTVTTGNFSGVELMLDKPVNGQMVIISDQVSGVVNCADLSPDAHIWLDAEGIGRGIRVVAMPDQLSSTAFTGSCKVDLLDGDTPIYLRVTQEDGDQGWSSPIYLCRSGSEQ